MQYKTPFELAHEANDALTLPEALAVRTLLATLKRDAKRTMIAEAICEAFGWYGGADYETLDDVGHALAFAAQVAMGGPHRD